MSTYTSDGQDEGLPWWMKALVVLCLVGACYCIVMAVRHYEPEYTECVDTPEKYVCYKRVR